MLGAQELLVHPSYRGMSRGSLTMCLFCFATAGARRVFNTPLPALNPFETILAEPLARLLDAVFCVPFLNFAHLDVGWGIRTAVRVYDAVIVYDSCDLRP